MHICSPLSRRPWNSSCDASGSGGTSLRYQRTGPSLWSGIVRLGGATNQSFLPASSALKALVCWWKLIPLPTAERSR